MVFTGNIITNLYNLQKESYYKNYVYAFIVRWNKINRSFQRNTYDGLTLLFIYNIITNQILEDLKYLQYKQIQPTPLCKQAMIQTYTLYLNIFFLSFYLFLLKCFCLPFFCFLSFSFFFSFLLDSLLLLFSKSSRSLPNTLKCSVLKCWVKKRKFT